MKLAVIGGGTAGYMAAAQITKFFPQFELDHIYNSKIPTIGVGEGTQAHFPRWLEAITGLNFAQLQARCNITRKYGILFENWGTKHQQFMHNFYPIKTSYGYHLSATKLVELLQEYVVAHTIDRQVEDVVSDGVKVQIRFTDGSQTEYDFVFDARGFPPSVERNQTEIDFIPTNAALIRRGEAVEFNRATRSVARPYGWIFIIPLTSHTSYGYVYNQSINSRQEIEADLEAFLALERVKVKDEAKHLTFPNFSCDNFFDGALFKIGNRASFLEPLEATALGVIGAQISYASRYPLQQLAAANGSGRTPFDPQIIEAFNRFLFQTILKIVLFISWHYSCGSPFKTDFWDFARTNFETQLDKFNHAGVLGEFQKYLQAGSKFGYWQYFSSSSRYDFAGITPASFYEIGNGIGYFDRE